MKSAAKYGLYSCRYRCEINNLIREKTGISAFFIFFSFLAFLTPFYLLDLLFFSLYPAFVSAWLFSSTLLGTNLCFAEIAGSFATFLIVEIALEAHPVIFAAKLQSHYQILALDPIECLRRQVISHLATDASR